MSTTANNNTINNANANQEQQEQQVQEQQTQQVQEQQEQEAEATQEAEEVQEAESVNNEEGEEIEGTIIKTMLPEGSDDRMSFVLDKEFDTIDFTTGEVKRTNIFGMNIYAVVNQVAQFVPYIQLADALALGKMVNPQIISLSMNGANVKLKRVLHNQGEQRRNTSDVYARTCKTTEFVKVKPNIKPIFEQMLNQLIATAPAIVKKAAIPNPFGM